MTTTPTSLVELLRQYSGLDFSDKTANLLSLGVQAWIEQERSIYDEEAEWRDDIHDVALSVFDLLSAHSVGEEVDED